MLAFDLLFRVAVQLLSARVQAYDGAIQRLGVDGIDRVFHDEASLNCASATRLRWANSRLRALVLRHAKIPKATARNAATTMNSSTAHSSCSRDHSVNVSKISKLSATTNTQTAAIAVITASLIAVEFLFISAFLPYIQRTN